jgi:hypothetical protein
VFGGRSTSIPFLSCGLLLSFRMCGFPLSYPIYFPQALASMNTDELEPPTLLCGFSGKRKMVDFIAQAVAGIDF